MNDFVRFYFHGTTGLIKLDAINREIQACKEVAEKVLKKENADHVIYASKDYAKNGNDLESVHFYNPPIALSDEEYNKRVNAIEESRVVYALHKNKKEVA